MGTPNLPDKIYIQPNAHDKWWDGNKPNDNFQEYIRKDALLEWLKEKISDYWADGENEWGIYPYAFEEVINKLNEM